jgi:prepilin-type N-terminal cleavage/methylation domain-containing protein
MEAFRGVREGARLRPVAHPPPVTEDPPLGGRRPREAGEKRNAMKSNASRRREAGFTLVEILVVITIIAALIGLVATVVPKAQAANRRTQCANNLRNIGQAILVRLSENKPLGTQGGSAMLLNMYKNGGIRKGDERIFLCPGDILIRQQDTSNADFMKGYSTFTLDNFDPLLISYAGRNLKQYPLRLDLNEKLELAVDCQGADGTNGHHPHGVNCLYDDGSVLFLDREALGMADNMEEPIVVGPTSANETLRKFCVFPK